MHPAVVMMGVTGLVVLGGSVLGAWRSDISPAEQRVFGAINGLPNWLYWPLWGPMQLGNLVVGTGVGLAIALLEGEARLAVAVLLAMVLKLAAERLLRRWMQPHLAVRQRPGTSQPDAILRGSDVPDSGPSFPSGHVILVAAVGAVLTVGLAAEGVWIPWLLAGLVAFGRVYVGAHNPLDVTAGLGLGMIVGALLAVPLG